MQLRGSLSPRARLVLSRGKWGALSQQLSAQRGFAPRAPLAMSVPFWLSAGCGPIGLWWGEPRDPSKTPYRTSGQNLQHGIVQLEI